MTATRRNAMEMSRKVAWAVDLATEMVKADEDKRIVLAWAVKTHDLVNGQWQEYVDRNNEHISESECVDMCVNFMRKPLVQRKATLDHGPIILGNTLAMIPITREYEAAQAAKMGIDHIHDRLGAIMMQHFYEEAWPMVKASLNENGYRRFSIGGWWSTEER